MQDNNSTGRSTNVVEVISPEFYCGGVNLASVCITENSMNEVHYMCGR